MRRSVRCLVGFVLAALPAATAHAADEATWVRYPAISPDGQSIAFSYRGDIWVVPAPGGDARRITSHDAHETRPVWSPDGARIAFASDRNGNFDVYVAPAAGGAATRLTYHSSDDVPCDFEPDGARVLFASTRQDAPASILPSSWIPELWSIPVGGGRPQMELTTPAQWARVSPDGARVVYEDRRGYENDWRKHHVSPVTRDVWIWDRAQGAHTRLTEFAGEDRNPVWGADGAVWFLSEREGAFDVWRRAADGTTTRATHMGASPVRFLSASREGTVCFGWDGGVYLLRDGAEPQRVTIRASRDERRNALTRETLGKDATDSAASPDGKELAFVVRGDVYVASVEHGTTRRITHTVEQERSVAWAPDGKALYYAGERPRPDGGATSWNLYRARLAHPEDERFFRATAIAEDVLLADAHETFQPVPSPDGASLAFLRDRDELCRLDLATNAVSTLVPSRNLYSYSDGDVAFSWSPDARFVAVSYLPNHAWIEQIGVVEVATGVAHDVTLSGYFESNPKWSHDGRALLFSSDRLGRRSHGSWGSDQDVFALYLTQAAYDRAVLSPEEYARVTALEEKAKEEQKGAKKEGDAAAPDVKPAPPVVTIEFDGLEKRLRRATRNSAPVADHVLSHDGESLLTLAEFEGTWSVWLTRLRKGETRRLFALGEEEGGALALSEDGATLFVRTGDGRVLRADVSNALGDEGGELQSKPVEFAAEVEIDREALWRHLYEHIWRQAGEKFYRPDLHGADWPALHDLYARFLPEIDDGFEFAELASELLGELNASHTGCRYRPEREDADATAALGLLYATQWEPDGLRIAEVLRRGPCARATSRIRAGHVLTAIDGVPLGPQQNPFALLNRQAGKRLRLTLRDPAADASYDEVVLPISLGEESGLLYDRLIDRRRAIVAEASGGRLGYVHVAGMDEGSFRVLYREALGRSVDREGLLLDTRYNGGGWLHEDLVQFLTGRAYLRFVPRGKQPGDLGGEPLQRWSRPSCVIVSEGNYSDAHMFPFAYQTLGIGKVVGAPVAGTGTAVWWERLVDPTLVFGIPQVGMMTDDGGYLENRTLEPDVLVLTDPVKIAAGIDEQLLAGVRTLLDEIDGK
mgnify:CR=1 FL=1